MSKESSGRPRYLQIHDTLLARIRRGEYPLGEQIPTKAALLEEFGGGVNTIERAIEELRRTGVVETFHGRGSFVRSTTPKHDASNKEVAALQRRVAHLEAVVMDVCANLGLDYGSAGQPASSEEAAG